jgi:hypothetical protein
MVLSLASRHNQTHAENDNQGSYYEEFQRETCGVKQVLEVCL